MIKTKGAMLVFVSRRILLILIALINITYTTSILADIPTNNAGEKAMIAALRAAIDHNQILSKQNIVLAAGSSGCRAFHGLKKDNEIRVFMTWQWLDCMDELAKGTIVVIPSHAVDQKVEGLKNKLHLIKIQGVLHTLDADKVNNADISKIINNPSIIVMLAGDTEHSDGSWSQYTVAMVDSFLKTLPHDQNILFLNGPRTGKHKRIGKTLVMDEKVHRSSIDEVTSYVIKSSKDKPWVVEDFNFSRMSLWPVALKYCLNNPSTSLILPGESVSMISEVLALGIRPSIYQHQAVDNNATKKYEDYLFKNDMALLYPALTTKENSLQSPLPSQVEVVIRWLLKHINSL